MSWQLLTAVSVVGLSISILLQRVLLSKDKSDPIAYVILFQALVGLVTITAAFVHGFHMPDFSSVWFPASAAVALYGVGHVVYAKTLQRVEASVFSVLFATQAVWIMALGVMLFHESLTLLQIAGTLLIFVSVAVLVWGRTKFNLDKGTAMGLLTGLLFGLAITAWGYVGRHVDTLSWAGLSFLAPALLALLISPKSVMHMKPFLHGKVLVRIVLLSLFYAIGCAAMLYAYKAGDFSLVSAVRQSGIIVTVVLAFIFFRQERTHVWRKIAAALVCFAGIVLVTQ